MLSRGPSSRKMLVPKVPASAKDRIQPAADSAGVKETHADDLDPRLILTSIGELVYHWDIATDKLSWGPNVTDVLGPIATQGDISTGLTYGQYLTPQSITSRYEAIFNSEARDDGYGALYKAVYELASPDDSGRTLWIEDCGRWFQGPDRRPASAQGVVRVVTERREKERLLSRRSLFDALTGALNRASLAIMVEKLLPQAIRDRQSFAVLLVAIENLFALNRNYGYDAGDEVIAGLAVRLRSILRAADIVGRHAGNKFAVVVMDCDADQCQAAAQRIVEEVAAAPFSTSAGTIPAAVRIGAVVAPQDGRSAQILFQHAEEALDFARQERGGRVVFFEASLSRRDDRLHTLQVADSIISALNQHRVELAYQPIVRADTGALAYYEALLRIRLPDGEMVSPGAILPVAEKAGLVRMLDHRVLDLAVARLAADDELRISVNASMATLCDPEWPNLLANALAGRPGLGARLTLEITETTMIEDFETTRRLIAACKRLGVKVAIDDFGAGHTSFRNLRELAFDVVKIDGVFIQNIARSEDDRFFVRTLVNLAQHLGIEVVAEWVEDEATAKILREIGVDYFQGALFGQAKIRGPESLDLSLQSYA
jgi:diguanylate cyclase (GGDEF)-like protein